MMQVIAALIVGLLLVPVGAATGTLVTLLLALMWETNTKAVSVHTVLGFLAFGTTIGSLFAFPVTMIALPTAYAFLRWRRMLGVRKLVIVGFFAGAVSIWLFTQKMKVDAGFWFLFAAGTISGLVVGFAFAWAMRRWQGSDWIAHAAKPTYQPTVTR